MRTVTVSTDGGPFRQAITIGSHRLVADEPWDKEGHDEGPEPHELILAALGTCTSMTVMMYARRKGFPLEHVDVTLRGEKHEGAYVITRTITLRGELDGSQREKCLEIASKCPVHRTLSGEIRIESSLT